MFTVRDISRIDAEHSRFRSVVDFWKKKTPILEDPVDTAKFLVERIDSRVKRIWSILGVALVVLIVVSFLVHNAAPLFGMFIVWAVIGMYAAKNPLPTSQTVEDFQKWLKNVAQCVTATVPETLFDYSIGELQEAAKKQLTDYAEHVVLAEEGDRTKKLPKDSTHTLKIRLSFQEKCDILVEAKLTNPGYKQYFDAVNDRRKRVRAAATA